MVAEIFISYKREDAAAARILATALKGSGFSVWFDEELTSGDAYRHVIRSVIDYCTAVVVVWSKQSVRSEFVLDEATYAKKQCKLCPIRIDDVELPFGHGQQHTDNLIGWQGNLDHTGFVRLLASLKRHVENYQPSSSADQAKTLLYKETTDFKKANGISTTAALKEFLKTYPDGPFSNYVKERIAERRSIKFQLSRLPPVIQMAAALLIPTIAVVGIYQLIDAELLRRTGLPASVQFDEPVSEERLMQLTRQALDLSANGECSGDIMETPLLSACRDQSAANKAMLNRLGSIVNIQSEGRKRLNGTPGTVFRVKFANGEMRWAARGLASGKLGLLWSE